MKQASNHTKPACGLQMQLCGAAPKLAVAPPAVRPRCQMADAAFMEGNPQARQQASGTGIIGMAGAPSKRWQIDGKRARLRGWSAHWPG